MKLHIAVLFAYLWGREDTLFLGAKKFLLIAGLLFQSLGSWVTSPSPFPLPHVPEGFRPKMKDTVNAFANLRDDLHRIGQWCSNNLSLLNPSKIKLLVFGSRQIYSKLVTPSFTFMGRELVPEHTANDLRVILDTNLTCDERITKPFSSCMSCLSQISRTKHFLTNAPY